MATPSLRGAAWEGHRASWAVSGEEGAKTVQDGPGTAKAAASLTALGSPPSAWFSPQFVPTHSGSQIRE